MIDTSLRAKLAVALASRDKRMTRRRLPETNSAPSSTLIDFQTNDYLSLSSSKLLRSLFLKKLNEAPDILGAGGSRLLVNGQAHKDLEERLVKFFRSEAALLFSSGYDANIGFFSTIAQPGDVMVHDEHIHASVIDGMKSSRVRDALFPFSHNSLQSMRDVFTKLLGDRPGLRSGANSVIVVVESVYSMEGTLAPLLGIVELLESLFPRGNAHLVVDEVHATGIFGPQGRGRVAQLGLESKVFARILTFGKSLAVSGAVILTDVLVRDYLLNYARSLIYTTSLNYATIIAIDCAFDLMEDGTIHELSLKLLDLSSYYVSFFRPRLVNIPSDLLSLPSHLTDEDTSLSPCPIIPLMTSMPWSLSAYLLTLGINTSAITPPTVPTGRLRVCLHAGNTKQEVEKFVLGAIQWAEGILAQQEQEVKQEHQGAEGQKSAGRVLNISFPSKL